jgi:hypothetical protein
LDKAGKAILPLAEFDTRMYLCYSAYMPDPKIGCVEYGEDRFQAILPVSLVWY